MGFAGELNSYLHSLGEALHYELKALGVYVTVLSPGPTKTDSPVMAVIGNHPKTMLMNPMSVEQCVSEGLNGNNPIQGRSWSAEPHHERTGANVGQTEADRRIVSQSARH